MTTIILILIALFVGTALGFCVFAMLQVSHHVDGVEQRLPQDEVPTMEL